MSVKRLELMIVLALVAFYLGSYLVLSRRGFADADRVNGVGFHFFSPQDSAAWRMCHRGCVVIYYPLIVIDNWLGTGRPVASEPHRMT